MNSIFAALTEADKSRIAFTLILILSNFVLAVVGAIVRGGFDPKAGGFDWKKLPTFFTQQVLPYVVGLAVFEAFLHVLPPSELVQSLTDSAANAAPTGEVLVETPSGFAWLDPTTLWTVYTAMVGSLVASFSKNLTYLFGKGIEAANKAKDNPA